MTFIQYDINENGKTAIFQFYKDDYNGRNKACLLTMNIDIDKNKMTKITIHADERLWILKECAKMKSVKVEAPPDAKSPEQMLREIKQEIERRKNL